jgi:hypothetical protein
MSTRLTALVTVLASVAVICGVVVVVLMTTRTDEPKQPARNAKLWDEARFRAELACSHQITDIHSDDFRDCVKDEQPRQYAELEEGNR